MAIPKKMRAVLLTAHGGIDKLVYRDDVTVPKPDTGEVLIEVHACGVNNTDINTRTAWYSETVSSGITESGGKQGFEHYQSADATWAGQPLTFPRIQGADVAGRIVAVGAGVSEARLNEAVITDGWLRDPNNPNDPSKGRYFGSECDGGFADYTVIPALNAHRVDSSLSGVELATFNVSYATGENLLSKVSLSKNETVLITGASGGVGSAMIQLAKRRGAKVIAMTSPEKFTEVLALGADFCVPRDCPDLRRALMSHDLDSQVDVVADVVGGAVFPMLIDSLKPGGRYGTSGAIAGPDVQMNLRHLIYRDLAFYGATFLPPEIFAAVVSYIERGEIKPVVAKTFALHELGEAQSEFIDKQHVGNIVIDHSL